MVELTMFAHWKHHVRSAVLRALIVSLLAPSILMASVAAPDDIVMFCSGFESPDCQVTGDELAPVFVDIEPVEARVTPGNRPILGARIIDERSGVDPASLRFFHDGIEVTAAMTWQDGVATYQPEIAPAAGLHMWRLVAADLAGNPGEMSWRYQVGTRPELADLSPAPGERITASEVRVRARITDLGTDLPESGLTLHLDGVPVDLEDAVTRVDARTLLLDWVPPEALTLGDHELMLRAGNAAQITAHDSWGFWVDEPAQYIAEFVAPEDGAHTRDPLAKIVVKAAANRTTVASVLVNGVQAGWEGDATGQVVRYHFLPLEPGINTITAVVGFADGTLRTITRTIHFDAPPQITFDTPVDQVTLGPSETEPAGSAQNLTGTVERPVRVAGRIDVPVQSVRINQQAAVLASDGRSFVFDRFFLHEGHNILTAEATSLDGRHATSSISVHVDHTAPLLNVESPSVGSKLTQQRVDVRGQVVDAVGGFLGTPEPQVTIRNLASGVEVAAQVDQQFFIARDVPLEVGINRLETIAVDGVGNERRTSFQVSRVLGAGDLLAAVAGAGQSGISGDILPVPMTVVLVSASGDPIAGAEMVFDVIRGDGALRQSPGQPDLGDGLNPARRVEVMTDANGEARAWLQLGTETGLAANVVRARRAGIGDEIIFASTVLPSGITQVLPDGTAGFQYASAGSPVVEPLAVVVLDGSHNRLEGVAVRFEVLDGEARLPIAAGSAGDGSRFDTVTDHHGRAAVRPIAGWSPGRSRIRASVPAAPASDSSAMFEIVAVAAGNGPTGFAGVVQDHTGLAIAQVAVSIGRTGLTTTTDVAGRFEFPDGVPAGKVDLFIDGRMVSLPNGLTYPALHFEVPVIAGVLNQLPHAIYLPPMNLSEAKVVGGDEDVALTIPGFEGFELIVKANSVTFPDGSRVGPVLLSPVHADRLPMVPPGGSASFGPLAWTIQPSSTRFDPPIEVRIPNTGGLRPGETASIVQWDHDLATFVPMGLGTVNEAATQIVSNPGSGISKAGWGGCTGDCPPPPPNCGTGEDGPRPPGYQEIRAFNLRREFFGWLEFEDPVELDRISKNHKTRFKDKTFRLVNGFWDSDRCDSVRIDWLFGDGGSGTGETVDHQYEERGPTTVRETIHCFYTSQCDGQPASKQWPEDFPIKRRDTRWIEYREALDECGWTAECWIHVNAMESLDEIVEEMGQIEVEWLTDLQGWNRETLDMMGPGAAGVPSSGKLATLAFLHAANESVFPTTILDIVPVGKATKALKLLRGNYNLSPGELKHLSQEVARACSALRTPNAARACTVAWQRFELVGLDAMALQKCPLGCLKKWQPVRNTNNGFDGAAVWRDPFGKLQLSITESKMWSHATSPVQTSDLTAFGFGADPSTLQRNIDQVMDDLRLDPNFSIDELDDLAMRLNGNPRQFDVFIHVLHENRLEWAAISERINALTGRMPVQINSWRP
ncbi:MAG: hypothetical protein IPK97_18200 [Ahniella sp.]|nr:hypothetical protein [Ahniella sp.]